MSIWRHDLTRRLERLRLRPEREAEIVEELAQHLDDHVRELVAGGAVIEEARRRALAELDEPGRLEQRLAAIEARSPLHLPPPGAPSRLRALGAFWQDVRYAVASLRRTPAFTLTVVTTLALTIGPTTAILSVGHWLLLRPPPGVVESHRLGVVYFGEWESEGAVSPRRMSPSNLIDLQRGSRAMAGIAGWQESSASLAAAGVQPRRAGSAHATVNFFDLLGVRPAAGRPFTDEDDRPPFGSPVAVLGDAVARGMFGTPESALGKMVTINGRRLTVIGVMPPGFVGARPLSSVDVWVPSSTYYYVNHFRESVMLSRQGRGTDGAFYTFVVKLVPGASFEALQAELDVRLPALVREYPDENKGLAATRARVFPRLGVNELSRDQYATLVSQLLIVGGVLLLLGCANVANLLISQGVRRQREHAVRVALGASRRRLAQLLLTESCVLAIAGATLGVAAALGLKELIRMLLLPGVAGAGGDLAVPVDLGVLLATLGVSVACGLAAGVAPAWLGSAARIGPAIGRRDLRTSTGGSRVRAVFAAVQLALSLALVTNALLMVATLRNFAGVDLGFDPRGVSVHAIDLGSHGYTPERMMAYNQQLLERLSSERAIQAVSLSSGHPPGYGLGIRIPDPAGGARSRIDVGSDFVTEGYFDTLKNAIVMGRSFTRGEAMSAAQDGAPVILESALARRLFGDANPIGRRVGIPATRSRPAHALVVVGVVRDIGSLDAAGAEPRLYMPFAYEAAFASRRPVVMIRSDRPIREIARLVEMHATALDASLPVRPPQPLMTAVERQIANRRLVAWVLSLLGALGFVLAAVGLYGLLAQMVTERTREFGIRIAIGADRAHVFGLVLRQASWIAILGGGAGLGLAALGSRLVETQLFGVARLDPRIYAAAAAGLAAIVLLAGVWPARAATRIQPVEALRGE